MNCKFCAKHINFEFRKISDDLYSIIDLSDYEFKEMLDVSGLITLKIKTPAKETFELLIPAGNSQIFSAENKGLICLQDGIYCVEVTSCGVPIKKNIGFFPKMEGDINNLIVTTVDKATFKELRQDFEIMKILYEYGDTTSGERIYRDLQDLLKGCRSPGACMGKVQGHMRK